LPGGFGVKYPTVLLARKRRRIESRDCMSASVVVLWLQSGVRDWAWGPGLRGMAAREEKKSGNLDKMSQRKDVTPEAIHMCCPLIFDVRPFVV
jgi:hypothetical protein